MIDDTLPLFEEAAGERPPLTPEAAGVSQGAAQLERIFQYIHARGWEGCTRPEAARALGINPNSVSPAFHQLEGRPDERSHTPRDRAWWRRIAKTANRRGGAAVYVSLELGS